MSSPVNVLDFKNPSIRTLHLSWVAFFITFVVWFSHAPLMAHLKEAFDLSSQQLKALGIVAGATIECLWATSVEGWGRRSRKSLIGKMPAAKFTNGEKANGD